jgi:phosphatidylserine/phosphatidylglycerophosphate/cardiolipin synthase-like enzyme
MLSSELAIARFSGWRGNFEWRMPLPGQRPITDPVTVSFLTEGAILDHLLAKLAGTRNGDAVRIAVFYLSDRKVAKALLDAANRGVSVKLILDPNKDAFGRQKDGVPNRPIANELVSDSGGRIEVRWYRTQGEQFHTKLALITQGDTLSASLGSANFTRRNLGNFNLEANLATEMSQGSPLARQMLGYFDELWSNTGAQMKEPQFTAPYGAYEDTDAGRYWRYRLMEATGLGTF